VTAHFDAVDWQFPPKPIVHLLQSGARNQSVADFRLIGDNDKEVAGASEPIERRFCLGIEMKIFKLSRRKASAIAHFRHDKNPVTIEKYRPTSKAA
jgi:hypothetical protein